jgi:mannose-6-phosphate isomerase-like protein (cupin superfamily)
VAIHFNESSVAPEPFGANVSRRRLITESRVAGTHILVDRWSMPARAGVQADVPESSLVWLFVISGGVTMTQGADRFALTDAHTAFLPASAHVEFEAGTHAEILYVEVPEADRFDSTYPKHSGRVKVVDWKHEPVLQSQHDARQRIYVATPKLFGTTAFKAEMIVYPPGTAGSNHHHEGCEHFKYIISGSGTGYTNEDPHPLRGGDIVYHYDCERHYSETCGAEALRFIEFFVPGEFRTVWVNEERVCAWLPSGKDAYGGKPARHIEAHSSAPETSPADV